MIARRSNEGRCEDKTSVARAKKRKTRSNMRSLVRFWISGPSLLPLLLGSHRLRVPLKSSPELPLLLFLTPSSTRTKEGGSCQANLHPSCASCHDHPRRSHRLLSLTRTLYALRYAIDYSHLCALPRLGRVLLVLRPRPLLSPLL